MKAAALALLGVVVAGCSGSGGSAASGSASGASSGSGAATGSTGSAGSGASGSSGSGAAASSASTGSAGSAGTTGAATSGSTGGDGGPPDAGIFRYDAGLAPAYCVIMQGGRAQDAGQGDGGCVPTLACLGTPVPLEPELHVPEPERVAYLADPPPSGPHWPCWAPWGSGHATRALPAERFVHNLEHGGVVLLYRCDPDAGLDDGGSCAAMAEALVAFAADGGPAAPAGDMRYLVAARPELPTVYAALAWGWRLELSTFDPAEVSCFAGGHLGAAPENFGANPDPAGCPQSYAP